MYIDYRKAFDFVNRPLLWQTLLSYEFNGKLFNVVKHIYDKAKFSINNDTLWSHYFVCNVGVRQGDNMSPSLFALFINDFFHYISQSYKGLNISRTCYPSLSNEYLVFYKLLVLLYADDTVILVENDRNLQMALASEHEYCSKYKLTVNISKTKIMISPEKKLDAFICSSMATI